MDTVTQLMEHGLSDDILEKWYTARNRGERRKKDVAWRIETHGYYVRLQ